MGRPWPWNSGCGTAKPSARHAQDQILDKSQDRDSTSQSGDGADLDHWVLLFVGRVALKFGYLG